MSQTSLASPYKGLVFRRRWLSIRLDARTLLVSGALVLATLVVSILSLSLGDFNLPIGKVVLSLLGRPSPETDLVVFTLRMPRVIAGLVVGAVFAMSGALFQSLTRNPLGSPDIMGFNSGAALGALSIIIIANGSGLFVSVAAVAGGLLTAAIVYLLSLQRGLSVFRLVLVGIGIGFVATAAVDTLMIRAELMQLQRATIWITGSLNAVTYAAIAPAIFALVVFGPIAVWLSFWLDRLELGDDAAAGLGVRVGPLKLMVIVTGVCLAALGVSATGPIAFIAFVAGPIARRLTGQPGVCLLPSALVGALLTISADLIARIALSPLILPVGVVTAIIGAPYLLWLLSRQIRAGAF